MVRVEYRAVARISCSGSYLISYSGPYLTSCSVPYLISCCGSYEVENVTILTIIRYHPKLRLSFGNFSQPGQWLPLEGSNGGGTC